MQRGRLRSRMHLMRAITSLKNLLGPVRSVPNAASSVTVRYAQPQETQALASLAELDSSRAPAGVVIVAEVGGQLWAAVSLDDGHTIADPFRPASELAFLLTQRDRRRIRARSLRGGRIRVSGLQPGPLGDGTPVAAVGVPVVGAPALWPAAGRVLPWLLPPMDRQVQQAVARRHGLHAAAAGPVGLEHPVAVPQVGDEVEAVDAAPGEQNLSGVLRGVPGGVPAHEVAVADALLVGA